ADVVDGDRRPVRPAGAGAQRERRRPPVRRLLDRGVVGQPSHLPPARVDPEQLRQDFAEDRLPGQRPGLRVERVEAGRLRGDAEPQCRRPRPDRPPRPPPPPPRGRRRCPVTPGSTVAAASRRNGVPDPDHDRHDGGPEPPGRDGHFDEDESDTAAPSNAPSGSMAKPFTRDAATMRVWSWPIGTTTYWSSTSCSAFRYRPSRLAGSASARAATRVWSISGLDRPVRLSGDVDENSGVRNPSALGEAAIHPSRNSCCCPLTRNWP